MANLIRILAPTANNVLSGGTIGVGTTIIDQIKVDDYGACRWDVVCRRSDGERFYQTVCAVHNGTASSDATDGMYEPAGGTVTSGAADQVGLAVALSGAGASQVLQLVATVSAGTWFVDVHRGPLVGGGG